MQLLRSGRAILERAWLIAFWCSAGLYVLVILLGKLGGTLPAAVSRWLPDNALQFLLLMAVSIFLVAAALAAERREDASDSRSDADR
jgi:hypothetical protein